MRTVNTQPPDIARGGAWMAAFADLLAIFRATAGRPPSDVELRQLFAHATETEVPR